MTGLAPGLGIAVDVIVILVIDGEVKRAWVDRPDAVTLRVLSSSER